MELKITDQSSVQHIQDVFSKHFPFLKIEFYNKAHKALEASGKESLIPSYRTLGEIRAKHLNGHVDISKDMTVSQLENEFKNRYDLNVQVFRKSGKIWLQTTSTDTWTLAEQNEEGAEMSQRTPED